MFKNLSSSLSLVALATLAACSSTPLNTPPSTGTAATSSGSSNSGASSALSSVATVTLDPLDDPKSGLAERSVYFGFDDYSVDPKYQPLIEAHGHYLQSHPKVQVKVEGNTDERGGAEYNLALGEKRAQAVAKQLQLMGAGGSQVEAVSFGSERPKADGHDESAWSQNRRDDIRYVR